MNFVRQAPCGHFIAFCQRRGFYSTKLRTAIGRRRRLVHIYDIKERRGPVYKLDNHDEKLMYLALGYTVKLGFERLPEGVTGGILKIRKEAAKQLENVKGLNIKLICRSRRMNQVKDALVTERKILCIPFLTALNQRLIETLLLDEVVEINNLMPKILETFEELEARLPEERQRDRQSIPKCARGPSLDAHNAILKESRRKIRTTNTDDRTISGVEL